MAPGDEKVEKLVSTTTWSGASTGAGFLKRAGALGHLAQRRRARCSLPAEV